MNVVRITLRDYRGGREGLGGYSNDYEDTILGTVTASPPNHAFQEAFRNYEQQNVDMKYRLPFKEFKEQFKETSKTERTANFGLGFSYILTKEKVT